MIAGEERRPFARSRQSKHPYDCAVARDDEHAFPDTAFSTMPLKWRASIAGHSMKIARTGDE